jgi:hypothetical protein
MSEETQALLAYWPSGAYVVALVAAVFAAGWFAVSMKRLKASIAETGKRRQDLIAARAASKEYVAKAEARRKEMDELNQTAVKLFWKSEKTWIG